MRNIILMIITLCVLLPRLVFAQMLDYTDYSLKFYDEFDYPGLTSGACPTTTVGTTGGLTFGTNWWISGPGLAYGSTTDYFDPAKVTLSPLGSFPTFIRINEDHDPLLAYPRETGKINFIPEIGYGIIQIRARFPKADIGADPAFWTYAGGGTELDFPDVALYSNWAPVRVNDWSHYPSCTCAYGVTNNIDGTTITPLGISDLTGWHTYTVKWTPDNVYFYLDDNFLTNIPFGWVRTYTIPRPRMEIVLWTQGGASTPGQNLDIDWVKTYEKTCSDKSLFLPSVTTLGQVSSGEYLYKSITSSSLTPITTTTLNGTLFKAQSTVLEPNFISDESTLVTSYYPLPPAPFFPSLPPVSYGLTNKNGFFEIVGTPSCEPAPCYITPISGPTCVLVGSTIGLGNAMSGGLWSSGNPSQAHINPATGVVTGISSSGAFNVMITYTVGGCTTYFPIRVAEESCEGGNGGRPVGQPPVPSNNAITIFPNPAQNEVSVYYPCNSTGTLNIVINDVQGKTVYTEHLTCKEEKDVLHSINIAGYAPGLYTINLTLNDQHIVRKFTKY